MTSGLPLGPEKVRDSSDPGDEMQLRVRYQLAYGAILICGAASGSNPYSEIWCEHHDDYLARRGDDTWDGIQVKSAEVGGPKWTVSNKQFYKSVRNFARLERQFGDKMTTYRFVSNMPCFDTGQAKERHRSPVHLHLAVSNANAALDLDTAATSALDTLVTKTKAKKAVLWLVLKKLRLVQGPSLEGFSAEVAHEHVPAVPAFRGLPPKTLDGMRDELITRIAAASALVVPDPSKRWCCVTGADGVDPTLEAKRLIAADLIEDLAHWGGPPFRFTPTDAGLGLVQGRDSLSRLEAKLTYGRLGWYVPSMKARALSAEHHFLERAYRDKDETEARISQISGFVLGACSDARAEATTTEGVDGRAMLRRVTTRLRDVAENDAALVMGEKHDCLVGVAGLLTEDCSIWWSEEFDLEGEQS